MDKVRLESLKNTNSAFLTSIPFYIMRNIYGDSSFDFAKGLGLFELERIIYSALLHDNLTIFSFSLSGAPIDFNDSLSKTLINEGILQSLHEEFVNESDFVEIAIKEGNYGGLTMDEILRISGENSFRESIFSRMFEVSIEKSENDEKKNDEKKYFEPFDVHIKKLKFIHYLGAENNIPLITGSFEDDLLKIDRNLGNVLLDELIEEKYNKKELDELSNKIRNLKIFRQTTYDDIHLPPLMSEIVKNSKGKVDNFPTQLIKLRNQKEFKNLRNLLKEVQLEPASWTPEKISSKFKDIIKGKSKGNSQILEKAISIPLALIPTANELLSFLKTIYKEKSSNFNIALFEKFKIKKSYSIKPNPNASNVLVKDIMSNELSQRIERNRLLFSQKIKTLHNNVYNP